MSDLVDDERLKLARGARDKAECEFDEGLIGDLVQAVIGLVAEKTAITAECHHISQQAATWHAMALGGEGRTDFDRIDSLRAERDAAIRVFREDLVLVSSKASSMRAALPKSSHCDLAYYEGRMASAVELSRTLDKIIERWK